MIIGLPGSSGFPLSRWQSDLACTGTQAADLGVFLLTERLTLADPWLHPPLVSSVLVQVWHLQLVFLIQWDSFLKLDYHVIAGI